MERKQDEVGDVQIPLALDPSLATKFRDVRECLAHCIYQRGLGRVAADLDIQPSNLSVMLSGERHLDVALLERYVAHYNDALPIRFLASKFLQDPEMVKASALAALPELLQNLFNTCSVAGVALPKARR